MTIVLRAAARSSRNSPAAPIRPAAPAAVAISRQASGRRDKQAGQFHLHVGCKFVRPDAAAACPETAWSPEHVSPGNGRRHRFKQVRRPAENNPKESVPADVGCQAFSSPVGLLHNGWRRPSAGGRCPADRPTARCIGWRRPARPAAAPAASPDLCRSGDRPDSGRRPPAGSGERARARPPQRFGGGRRLFLMGTVKTLALGGSRRLVRRLHKAITPSTSSAPSPSGRKSGLSFDQPSVVGHARDRGDGHFARRALAAAGTAAPPRRRGPPPPDRNDTHTAGPSDLLGRGT